MNQLRILMMSPDEQARTAAVSALLQAGISARGCSTLELFGLLNSGVHDAVVLDVDALGEIGYALIARLRDQGWTLVAPSGTAISLSANERLIVRSLLEVAGGRSAAMNWAMSCVSKAAAPAARAAST